MSCAVIYFTNPQEASISPPSLFGNGQFGSALPFGVYLAFILLNVYNSKCLGFKQAVILICKLRSYAMKWAAT